MATNKRGISHHSAVPKRQKRLRVIAQATHTHFCLFRTYVIYVDFVRSLSIRITIIVSRAVELESGDFGG